MTISGEVGGLTAGRRLSPLHDALRWTFGTSGDARSRERVPCCAGAAQNWLPFSNRAERDAAISLAFAMTQPPRELAICLDRS